jgi:hypothetical protein
MLRQQGSSKGIAHDTISAEFGGHKTSGGLAKGYYCLNGVFEAYFANTTPTAAAADMFTKKVAAANPFYVALPGKPAHYQGTQCC